MDDIRTWFGKLQEMRERWLAANQENGFERGIWNATVEKYADDSHFVYELLQNAEDAVAQAASFTVTDGNVSFEHDGRPFERSDVEGITGIGNTTKLDGANKIGSFGIGFKSVYVVTGRPEIHSMIEGQPLSFAIRDLVVPEGLPEQTCNGTAQTRFSLPLREPGAAVIRDRVLNALSRTAAASLLHLRHLRRLDWTDGESNWSCTAKRGDDGVKMLRTRGPGGREETDRYLVFAHETPLSDAPTPHGVEIAFRLNDAGDVVQDERGTRLAVFFETEEQTGFRFRVHGPFRLTDNRANVKRGDAWNDRLVGEVAALLVTSLPKLRDRGMLKRSFLEVLPNRGDSLAEPWNRVMEAVVQAFRSSPLVPTAAGGFVPAANAIRGPADTRELLGDDGLELFARRPGFKWVLGGLRNSRADAFMSTIGVADWVSQDLLRAFEQAFETGYLKFDDDENENAEDPASAWFERLDDSAVQKLYLLADEADRTQKGSTRLRNLEFVRLEDGSRVEPRMARLPPEGSGMAAEAEGGLPLVRAALVQAKGSRGKDVETFLRRMGVQEVKERDYLTALVTSNYSPGSVAPDEARHLIHIRRLLTWHGEHRDVSFLRGTRLLRVADASGHFRGDQVYVDRPFARTGLACIYDGSITGRDRHPLWIGYRDLPGPEFGAMLKDIGVEESLRVNVGPIPYSHPSRQALRAAFPNSRATDTEVNTDWNIDQLAALLARKDLNVARLIWSAVASAGLSVLWACYAPNRAHQPRRAASTLALALRSADWLPSLDGTFLKPSAATKDQLPQGFRTEGLETFLSAIEFGLDDNRRTERHQTIQKAATTLGMPEGLSDRIAALSPESRERVWQMASEAAASPAFPERSAPNPARRAARVAERAAAAPAKTYDVRPRSVRISDGGTRSAAKVYLRDLYTNSADQMICQACHGEMPFHLADGLAYFEAPEFLRDNELELVENHLALCPTCSAKWQHARSATCDELRAAVAAAAEPVVEIELASMPVRLRFVEIHLADLRSSVITETDTDHD